MRKAKSDLNEIGIEHEEVDTRAEEMRFVILSEEETDGRARVTTEDERVHRGDWTEIRLRR